MAQTALYEWYAEAARSRGVPVYARGSCQPLSLSFTLDQAYILKAMSPWPTTEDHEALRRVLSDPSFRDAFRQTLARPDSQHIFKGHWDWVPVAITGVVRKNWIFMPCKGFLTFSPLAARLTPP